MKLNFRTLFSLVAAIGLIATMRAQQIPPVLTVSMTEIDVLATGSNAGNGKVVLVSLDTPGSGYVSPPTVTISGGGGGVGATAIATINLAGQVSSISITNAGSGYTSQPTVTVSAPGGSGVTAQATAYLGTAAFPAPFVNESYGPAVTPIALTALAVGTFPSGGFTYEFFANGVSLGIAVEHPFAGTPASILWTPPQPGVYYITVTATDGAHTATSLPVRYWSTGTQITAPTNLSIVPAGSSVAIQAAATPTPLNSAIIGGAGYTSAPTVTISGGGGSGATATASLTQGVTQVVVNNGGSGYTSNPSVTISGGGGSGATALSTVTNGVVTRVAITSPGSGYTSTPTVTIAPPASGTTATGTASVSGVVSSVTVTAGGTGYTSAPSVALTGGGGSGATGIANISGGAVTGISLTASNAFVQRLDFYADGALIGSDDTAPYSIIYTPSTTLQSHTIEAKAYDNNGNQISPDGTATLKFNTVPAIGTPPVVSIATPANNAVEAIGTIPIGVSAGSATGFIKKVELYVDGDLLGTATTFPYNFTWNPTVVGTYHLVALAYDDKGNIVASTTSTSATITPAPTIVRVAASPTVTLISPATGVTVGINSPTTLTAAASDSNVGGTISKVQFFANTKFLGESSTPVGNQFSFQWTPTTADTYIVTAVAINSVGLSTTSGAISVVASNGGGTGTVIGQPPTVSVSYPTASSQFTVNAPVTVSALASDPDGNIISVQFFANGQSIGSAGVYPYSVSWTPTSLGTYNLTAQATDNDGNKTKSAAVQVSVVDPSPNGPTVSVSSPVNGSSVTVGTKQTLTAAASDAVAVTGVQFYVNGQPQGTLIVTYPFTTTWTPAVPGTYTITARAINASGNQATSVPSTITVVAGTPPTVTLTSPSNGASITVGSTQSLSATASAASGTTIANVQFFANGAALGAPITAFPYTLAWAPTALGTYAITAVATDSTGNQTTSAAATVTVAPASSSSPWVYLTSTPTNTNITVNTPVFVSANAGDPDGTVASVGFYVNNQLIATKTAAPYYTTWVPTAAGTYVISAVATDNAGNQTTATSSTLTALAQVGSVPVTELDFNNPTVDTPTAGSSTTTPTFTTPVKVTYGSKLILTTSAVDQDGTINNVQFFVNGTKIASVNTAPFLTVYQINTLADLAITALVTDSDGNAVYTNPILISTVPSMTAGSGLVSLASPTDGATYSAGQAIVFSATHNFGTVNPPKIDFYVDGAQFATVTTPANSSLSTPIQYIVALTRPGNYVIHAVARVNNTTTVSTPARITVLPNTAPTVSVTAPANGSSATVGTNVTLTAAASDPDGTVASVQFYVNGQTLGSAVIAYPYTTQWTPAAEGVYQITAAVTDNAGAITLSSPVTVLVVSATSSRLADKVYSGPFNGVGDSGRFSVISNGKTATFIAYSTASPAKIYYFPDLTVDASGGFSGTDAAGHTVSGTVTDTGVTVTLNGSTLLIGIIATPSTTSSVPAGHYTGSLSGVPNSSIDAIVGVDGSIAVYVVNGSNTDVAAGTLTSAGTATLTSAITGSKFTVAISPTTGYLTGTISGTNGGTMAGALASGSAISDGVLRNLSTRGQVGTGANVLIAGFVVGGNTPKNVLVRAIGPSLSIFGLSGLLADPQLSIKNQQTGATIAFDDNWGGDASIAAASTQVGAFPINPGSADAAIRIQLSPGQYTAVVNGAGGTTGLALVEVYDVDSLSPFSSQKVMNLSTRGQVGSGANVLIAGFVVSGNIPKKVLIRAIGPSLTLVGLNTGYVADPMLRLSHQVNNTDTLIRENDNWQQGNDPQMVVDAETKVGAFPLNDGSKDSVILITLPPGSYTAQVSGANGSTGLALVEVYEVP